MAESSPAPGPWWSGIEPARHARRSIAQRLAHELGRALAATRPLSSSEGLSSAVGATLARDVLSPCPVPHYSSSAMDGYAVRGPGPWRLIHGDSSVHDAAATAHVDLAPGQAVAVVTGGVIPTGTDTVIRDEYALRSGNELRFDESQPGSELAGRHIRPAGAECSRGDVILRAGTTLTPADVAFAAVCGLDEVPVIPTPGVRLLLTGSEVQSSGIPAPGYVRDAFSPSLPPILSTLGARVETIRRIPDQARDVARAVQDAVAARVPLVITTGGTARSRADHVRAHLERHAVPVIDELDLQPGHPALFAAAEPATAVLALPGNPLAAMTALTLLAVPFLRGLQGRAAPSTFEVRVAEEIPGARRERLLPGVQTADGAWSPCRGVGANMLSGLSRAHALLSIPSEGLSAGDHTRAVDLPW